MTDHRIAWIDVAKGIGIVLVVFGHVARGVENAGIPQAGYPFALVDSVIYSFHMPLFFVLSGLLFLPSWESRGSMTLATRKAATILYPFVVWTLIQGTLDLLMAPYINRDVRAIDLLVGLWKPASHLWFLQTLFAVFVVNAMLLALGKRTGLILGSLLAVGLCVARGFMPELPVLGSFNLLYFNVGMLLGPLLPRVVGKHRPWLPVLGCGALFGAIAYGIHAMGRLPGEMMTAEIVAMAFSGSALAIVISIALSGRLAKLFGYLGRYSLEIYLMHVLAGAAVRIGLQKLGANEHLALHLTLGTTIGLFAPIVVAIVARRLGCTFLFVMPRK